LPRVRILHGLPGAAPARETASLQWKNADLLEAAISIAGRETVLNTVEISGQQPVILPPVCLPYSPEFAPDQPGRGSAALMQIAATTGGRELVEIPKIWGELPVRSRYVELAPWLLVLGAILFLLEILERRTGWVLRSSRRQAAVAQVEEEKAEAPPTRLIFPRPAPKSARTVAPVSTVFAEAKPAPEKPASTASTFDALRQARERAHRRTDKDH
jgi:hypothetical protein